MLSDYLEEHPDDAKQIIQKVILAARQPATKAKMSLTCIKIQWEVLGCLVGYLIVAKIPEDCEVLSC